jgi:hypothetical protein
LRPQLLGDFFQAALDPSCLFTEPGQLDQGVVQGPESWAESDQGQGDPEQTEERDQAR